MRELDDVILRLEDKLNYLSQELKNKKKVLETAYAEAEEMSARIDSNLQKKNGLCLRYVSQTSLSQLHITTTKIQLTPLFHLIFISSYTDLHRVLSKDLLSHVLSYLGPDSSVKATCKYWYAVSRSLKAAEHES